MGSFLFSFSFFLSLTLIRLIGMIGMIGMIGEISGEFIDTTSFIARARDKKQTCDELLRRGIEAYYEKNYELADNFYETALVLCPNHSDLLYNKGVLYHVYGDIPRAIQYYEAALRYNPEDLRIRLNLAAMYQMTKLFPEAIENLKAGLEIATKKLVPVSLIVKLQTNLATAYYQSGRIREAFRSYRKMLRLIARNLINYCSPVNKDVFWNSSNKIQLDIFDWESPNFFLREGISFASEDLCDELQKNYDDGYNLLLTSERSVVYLRNQEYRLQYLLYRTLQGSRPINIDNIKKIESIRSIYPGLIDTPVKGGGPLLPFDTFLYDISLQHRLAIARSASLDILSSLSLISFRIGFISYDFNDHPTARLLEGLLARLQSLRNMKSHPLLPLSQSTQISLFSYGGNDHSIYRQNLMQLSDQFIELSLVSNQEAANIIRQQDLDILLDMQIFTLGQRFGITAVQPTPLQVNYLVFPGTSGAPFLQYLVADHVVVPPEQSQFYSESLLYLPPSYQVSYYDRYDEEEMSNDSSRASDHIPNTDNSAVLKGKIEKKFERFVLANFNKVDKFDLESLQIWSQIMSRFPRSEFWFLDSGKRDEVTEVTRDSLSSHLLLRGISTSRILFVDRIDKEEHIRRHKQVDLFLDTIIYGAHSTATDAMKGGLSVVTLEGNSFPNRVASSLLTSLKSDSDDIYSLLHKILVTYSKKSYEDLVIRLLKSPLIIDKLNQILLKGSKENEVGFFNSQQSLEDFFHGMLAMKEIDYRMNKTNQSRGKRKYPHLLVTRTFGTS